jgi:hypothetical protein
VKKKDALIPRKSPPHYKLSGLKKRYFYGMIQQLIVGLFFLGALVYLGRLLYRSFTAKSAGCASGCGKCGASSLDLNKIEAQLKKSGKY